MKYGIKLMIEIMKSKLVLCMLLFFSLTSSAQIIENKVFIVITFERSQKGRAIENYFWTIPLDSLDKLVFKIRPLYVDTNSQHNVDECKNGRSINFFSSYEGSSNMYADRIKEFMNINSRQRVKLQEVSIKWNSEKKRIDEVVRIYGTAIKGTYCTCKQNYYIGSSKTPVFSTKVYLPISDFSIATSFWSSEASKIVKYADYSLIDFTRFIPYIYQDRKRSRAIIE